MNEFTRSIKKVFAGAVISVKDFPATIVSAFGFLLVTIVRIQMDWNVQESYNLLLDSLQWSFAFGAIFSLMLITLAHSRFNRKKAFAFANIISILAIVVIFVTLFYFSRVNMDVTGSYSKIISSLAIARVSIGMLVSYLVFIVFSGLTYDKKDLNEKLEIFNIDFPRALFMNHKAFFIAIIYGLVILAGASGVAGAVQALLYQDMSEKVYMYIAAITGFMVFTMFVGYFPDLRIRKKSEQRVIAEKQPRFIEILFGYIMVPLMIALTVVLLLWAGKVVITSMDVPIGELSGIAAAYTIGGIWLHMMVSDHESKLTKFYRRFYPFGAIIILIFEANALVKQVNVSGLKLTEYWFILVWLIAAFGSILLIILKSKAYVMLVAITCILAILSVSPLLGYNVLPVRSQINRLEKLLMSENMLKDDVIIPAMEKPDIKVREEITDAVNYLAYSSDGKLPSWFEEDLGSENIFIKSFGFEKAWPNDKSIDQSPDYRGVSLYLPALTIDISGYDWAINIGPQYEKEQEPISLLGRQGSYKIYWNSNFGNEIPKIEIELNDEIIIQKDMKEFVDTLLDKYSANNMEMEPANWEDMTTILESDEIKALLIFRNIEVSIDSQSDNIYYGVDLESIYILEKN